MEKKEERKVTTEERKSSDSGYTEPRPEQKSGEGQDLGQKQAETLNNADWNQRKGSEADPDRDPEESA